jgi:Spy/CpxP family protein refolding chaperone
MRALLKCIIASVILITGSALANAAEPNEGGGSPTTMERFEQWTEKNPDTWIGIQGGINNFNNQTPQQNALEGAAEALGAGIGQKLSQPSKPRR